MNKKFIIIAVILFILLVAALVWWGLKTQPPTTPTQPAPTILPVPRTINEQGDTRLFENEQFKITYLPDYNQYVVSISASPFADIRLQAEQQLLQLLNAYPQQACALNVVIVTTHAANPELAGQEYFLSFCSPTSPTPLTQLNPNALPLFPRLIHPPEGEVELGNTKNGIFLTFNQEIDASTATVLTTPEINLIPRPHPVIPEQLVLSPQDRWQPNTAHTLIIKAGLLSKNRRYQLKQDVVLEYRSILYEPFDDHQEGI